MEEGERTFTPGQAEAMDALLSGRNVFLSGNAGTGKSYVLNAFIEELEEREVPYLTMAPTGIAAQELVTDTVGAFTQIPLRLAFAITIHKSQGQTFERCAVHSKVFGAGMLYVALSRCTTFDGLTVWPKIERQRLYANESVIEFYDSLATKVEEVHEPSQGALFNVDAPTASLAASTESTEPMKPGDEDKVYIKCPAHIAERVRGYIDALMEGADGGYNQSCTQVAE